jgi:hypothetical protein
VTFTKLSYSGTPPNDCHGGTDSATVLTNTDFPGNSNFQYFTSTNTWQFNWQTNPPAVSAGCWLVRVILDLNKNKVVPDPGDQVNDRNPVTQVPLIVKLK